MHDLQTDQNHQRVERIVRRSARSHHQLDRRNMKKLLIVAAMFALAGCGVDKSQQGLNSPACKALYTSMTAMSDMGKLGRSSPAEQTDWSMRMTQLSSD